MWKEIGRQHRVARIRGGNRFAASMQSNNFGGPSNAQNITTIRPFSRKCATVSAPLPLMAKLREFFAFTDELRCDSICL
jgi:hypothetical protein